MKYICILAASIPTFLTGTWLQSDRIPPNRNSESSSLPAATKLRAEALTHERLAMGMVIGGGCFYLMVSIRC